MWGHNYQKYKNSITSPASSGTTLCENVSLSPLLIGGVRVNAKQLYCINCSLNCGIVKLLCTEQSSMLNVQLTKIPTSEYDVPLILRSR